ncbi:MAG: hypothetical protein QMC09_13120, partial [Thauera sp.]
GGGGSGPREAELSKDHIWQRLLRYHRMGSLMGCSVQPEGAAGEYLATLLANPHMQEWAAAARAETESIPEEDLYG